MRAEHGVSRTGRTALILGQSGRKGDSGDSVSAVGRVRTQEPHTRRREAPFGNYELLLLADCCAVLPPPPAEQAEEAGAEQAHGGGLGYYRLGYHLFI